MDFVRLGPLGNTAYVPDVLVEGYSSLIFTERFQGFGDFELHTYDVEKTMELLPRGAFVSHLETQDVMMVETHEVEADEFGVPKLTITGRTAECILEERYVASTYQKRRNLRRRYSAMGAGAVLLVNGIDNATGKDLTRGDVDADTAELNDYSWNTRDTLPNIAVTETVATEGSARWFWVEAGTLYSQLMRILESQDLGLRLIRPRAGNSGSVITVKSNLADRGAIVRTANSNITALRFDIYQGVDRRSAVQFSVLQGHLDKPKYLWSDKEYRTGVEMRGGISLADVYRSGEAGLTGWNRRMMDFDAGSPELPPEPEKPDELRKNATRAEREQRAEDMDKWIEAHAKWRNKRNRIYANFREEAAEVALNQLKQKRKISLLTSDISVSSPYVFKRDYNLGDLVQLNGNYGKLQAMVVQEYVRTEDASGDRGFPGFVEP